MAIAPGKVFISHASPDKPFVRALRSALEESGFGTWVDEHELLPGDDLPGTVASALADAVAFVVVISTHSIHSRWLKYELRLATQRMIEADLLVIPVRVDDAEAPEEIRSLLWADFRIAFDDGWRVLHAALERGTTRRRNGTAAVSTLIESAFDLSDSNRTRVRTILSEHLPEALRVIRVVEARSGYQSQLALTQLVDALSHLSLLATRNELSPDEQGRQIDRLEEHCQRAMAESSEELVRAQISDVATLWDQYMRAAFSCREAGVLRGVPEHSALETLRLEMRAKVEAARELRLSGTWVDARSAAAEWHEIATLCEELTDQLTKCLAAAKALDG